MKKLILPFVLLSILFTACVPNEVPNFDHQYVGSTSTLMSVPTGTGYNVPMEIETINCPLSGTNCDLDYLNRTELQQGVEHCFTDTRTIQEKDSYNENDLKNAAKYSQEGQVYLLRNYNLKGNPKDYFKNEKWEILFPKIYKNDDLKKLIERENYDLLFPMGSGTVAFVKNKNAGLSIDNVIYICKHKYNLYN